MEMHNGQLWLSETGFVDEMEQNKAIVYNRAAIIRTVIWLIADYFSD